MIITIVLLVVLVAYPMLQSVTLWARLTVVESERFQPLVDAPATMVSHLGAVLAFLDTHETRDRPARYLDPRKILERRHRATRTAIKDAERQLARAARSQRRIVDIFGPNSDTYEAATNAVNETSNALKDYLEITHWWRSTFESETPYPQRITNARDALDALTVTVERWQAALR